MHRHMTNTTPTPVIAELVALASKHTGLNAEYRDTPQQYAEMDWCDGAEAYENGYNENSGLGSIWSKTPVGTDMSPFWDELNRLQGIITKPLNEPILPDDCPVYQGYFYVANGKVTEFIDGMDMTVGRWKALTIKDVDKVTEVRRCDITGRRLRLPPKKPEVPSTQMAHRWNESGKTINQTKRRPRSSNKIKKVK